MASLIDDTSGTRYDIIENKGASLVREIENEDIVDFAGYTINFSIQTPSGVVTTHPTPVANTFEISVDTSAVPHGSKYTLGWTDPAGFIEVVTYGQILYV